MAKTEDPFEQMLTARMAHLSNDVQADSIVERVVERIEDNTKNQIEFAHAPARVWVLSVAAVLGAVIMMTVLAGTGWPLVDSAEFVEGLREAFTVSFATDSQSSLAAQYAWLVLLLPAGFLLSTEW